MYHLPNGIGRTKIIEILIEHDGDIVNTIVELGG